MKLSQALRLDLADGRWSFKETPNKLLISRKWAALGCRKARFSVADYWIIKAKPWYLDSRAHLSPHSRTARRIRFNACALTPGRKLVKSLFCWPIAFLGLKVRPRKVKLTCGYPARRLLSLQYTIFDFSGCIVRPQTARREAIERITCSACLWLRQCTTASSAYRAKGQFGLFRCIHASKA